MDALSKDKDFKVRAALAGNPNCPEYLLEELSGDEAMEVRAAVASNGIQLKNFTAKELIESVLIKKSDK